MDTQRATGKFTNYYHPEQLYSKALHFLCDERDKTKWESAWTCQIGQNGHHSQAVVLFDWQDRANEFIDSRDELQSYSVESVDNQDELKQFFRVQAQRGAEYLYINPDPHDRPPRWDRRRSIADILARFG